MTVGSPTPAPSPMDGARPVPRRWAFLDDRLNPILVKEVRQALRGRYFRIERRILLNDAQRRRLAVKGKALGRSALRDLACIVTPDTILRWP